MGREAVFTNFFSAGNYSFKSPFYCKSMGAGVSHAESLRRWSCSIAYRMWKNGWEGGEEKSCCTLMLLIPKALGGHRSSTSWCGTGATVTGSSCWPSPDASSRVRDWLHSTSPRLFCLPSLPSPMALVALRVTGDVPFTPRALQVELPPLSPVPHSVHRGQKRDLQSRGLDCCEGPCRYLSICMDIIESERRRKKPTKQVLEKSSSNNTCCRNGFQWDTSGLSFHFCNGSELLH